MVYKKILYSMGFATTYYVLWIFFFSIWIFIFCIVCAEKSLMHVKQDAQDDSFSSLRHSVLP